MILELVIAEEWAPNKKPEQSTPTGAARVLRTQFNLNVTERAGMGLSWDDEMPPMYEDVPASPPHYGRGITGDEEGFDYISASPPHYAAEVTSIMNYDGSDIHENVEQLNLGS